MPAWFNLGVAFPFLAGSRTSSTGSPDSPRLGADACVALHAGLRRVGGVLDLDLRFGFRIQRFLSDYLFVAESAASKCVRGSHDSIIFLFLNHPG